MLNDKRFAFYPECIPTELKPDDVWVCCDSNKVPLVARADGRREEASSTNPETWRPFAEAMAAYETGRYAGVGRVIVERGGLSGIDFDKCRNPETGRILPKTWELLRRLDSYTEVSPSLTGVKVWVRAQLEMSKKKPGLEVYVRGRYFTTTGQILPQFPDTVEERQGELEAIVAEEFPRKPPKPAYDGPAGKVLILDEFLEGVGVERIAEIQDGTAEKKYRITCPWVTEHTNADDSGTYVGQYEGGGLFFECHHAHCAGRKWDEFRDRMAPPRPNISSGKRRRRPRVYARRGAVI